MTIERQPKHGSPSTIQPGGIIEGLIKGVAHIAMSRDVGFVLRNNTAQAGTADQVVPVGEIIEFDNGTRLVSTAVEPVPPATTPYDSSK